MPKGTPAYLTQNPDGTIGADFSGHVFANGLDLLTEDVFSTSRADRTVTWHKTTKNGAVVAQVASQSLLPDRAVTSIMARSPDQIAQSALSAFATSGSPAGTSVGCNAGTTNRTIIRQDGISSFAQVANLINIIINGSGAVLTGSWTADRSGTVYTLMSASCFSTGTGLATVDLFRNGSLVQQTTLYHNEINSHKAHPLSISSFSAVAGTQYNYQLQAGSLPSGVVRDTNDPGTLILIQP